MVTLEEKTGDTHSVRITSDDLENAEELGIEQKPPSTVLTLGLEDSVELKKLREKKREELQNRLLDIKEDCKTYGIEFSELL